MKRAATDAGIRVAYLSASAGDWGGASRVLFTNLRLIDRQAYRPLVMLPAAGSIVPTLDELGIDYAIWGKAREPAGLFRYLRDIYQSVRFLKRHRVAILHINHANYWRPAELVAAKLLRIPVVTHYHVVVEKPGPFIRYSNAIVAVSDYVARHSMPRNIPYHTVYNAVDLQRFKSGKDIREELQIPREHVVFGFVGQIREIKGIDLFIQAARRIKADNVAFLIAGLLRGGYTEETLLEEIAGDERIKYLGYRSDIENIFETADVIVVPSRWEEPFGLINIEAGAAGKPVIATRSGGIPEIIEPGVNGFLFEKDDVDALVEYMNELVADPERIRQLGENAYRMVEERFAGAPLRRLEALYAELAD